MGVRIVYAPPGPEAEAALKRHWALAWELADQHLARIMAAKAQTAAAAQQEPERPEQ